MNAESSQRIVTKKTAWVFVTSALCLYPLITDVYLTDMMSRAILFGIFALSLDLIWGYTGILNLGHAAFFGLGAYTCALIMKHVDGYNASYVALISAVALPMILAMIVGLVTFLSGTSEIYFAIITLAVALLLEKVTMVWYNFTGGSNGIINIPPFCLGIKGLFLISIDSSIKYYYFVLIIAICVVVFCKILVNSIPGRVFVAIRDNEQRTAIIGYNVHKFKIFVYAISGGIGGLSGAIFGPLNAIVYPGLFGLLLSAQVLIWVAVGGRGTLLGAFAGGLVINLLEAFLSDVSIMGYLIALGLVFILIVVFLPDGLAGLVKKTGKPWGRRMRT